MSSHHHARRLYIGTSAEKTALSLTTDGRGIAWYDTDEDRLYIWSGSAWVEVTKISELYESDGGGPAWSVGATGNITAAGAYDLTTTGDISGANITASGYATADNFAFVVKNTSGATANQYDVGYIDEAGEYQTTTTANDDKRACVVVEGGANNADIRVARRGRWRVNYTGVGPSAGQFAVLGTTAGSAIKSSSMRPEVFAVALDVAAGGSFPVLLLCGREMIPLASTNNLLFVGSASNSDFQAVIASAGVSGDKVYHDPPSSGTVDAITPQATTELGKMVLHNTTQGEEALVIATGTDATDDFIQVSDSADISGWVTSDNIEVRSQTNTSVFSLAEYFFDIDLVSAEVPELTTVLWATIRMWDTGSTLQPMATHPYESNSNPKRQQIHNPGTNGAQTIDVLQEIPLISKRFVVAWKASGSGTLSHVFRLRGVTVATP